VRAIGVGMIVIGLIIAFSPFLAISFEEASKDKARWKWIDDFPAWMAMLTTVTGMGVVICGCIVAAS
jgi:hypothetical protein